MPVKKRNAVELLIALHKADGTEAIAKLPGLWMRKLDEHWTFWVNGHKETIKTEAGVPVQFTDCYVEFNGWPAGSFSMVLGEGTFAAGAAGNYDAFCAALVKAAQ